jgi:hypothetical protein
MWNVEFQRTTEKQRAWEFRCPDCDEHVAGLERDGFQKITVRRADFDEVPESENLFFPARTRR